MKIGYLLFHSWKYRFSETASIDKKQTPVLFDCEKAISVITAKPKQYNYQCI